MLLWRVIAHGTKPGHPHGLLTAWSGWDFIWRHLWPTTDIPKAPRGVLRIRLVRHHGPSLVLPDGTPVRHGDVLCELHCDNRALLRLSGGQGNPFRACREDLRALASWARDDDVGRQVVAVFGLTMLSKGAARLGFSLRELPMTVGQRFERVFMTGLLLLYSEEGLLRLGRGGTPQLYPQEVWMSRAELVRRYGSRNRRCPGESNLRQEFATGRGD